MSFTSSLLNILLDFFHSVVSAFAVDLQYEMGWIGGKISILFYSWAASISGFGIWIPSVLVGIVGVTVAGLYVVFVVFDAAKDVVG
jgi:hypothetical protein